MVTPLGRAVSAGANPVIPTTTSSSVVRLTCHIWDVEIAGSNPACSTKLYGEGSLKVKALDCDSRECGFESHLSPQTNSPVV